MAQNYKHTRRQAPSPHPGAVTRLRGRWQPQGTGPLCNIFAIYNYLDMKGFFVFFNPSIF